jgi:hypothetical protein
MVHLQGLPAINPAYTHFTAVVDPGKLLIGGPLALGRSGPSLLVQIQQALLGLRLNGRWHFTPYRIQLIESMLLECLEDPRPLMRAVLGKDHRLIREAEANAARPPPDSEQELANA